MKVHTKQAQFFLGHDMDQNSVFMWFTLIIFNVSTVRILTVSLSNIDIKSAMTEKDSALASPSTLGANTDLHDGAAASAQPDASSYSRVAGMVGATVLGTFLWAVGNVLLYKMLTQPSDLDEILNKIGTYFLAGASLFAPYAFNQLRAVFVSR